MQTLFYNPRRKEELLSDGISFAASHPYMEPTKFASMVQVESPFTISTIILKVALQPMHCQRPIEAVKRQLNDLLLKYSEDIQGVPLSYSGLELPRGLENGRILAEQPYVHVDLRATVTMFRPVRG